jgi:hypothetical protein
MGLIHTVVYVSEGRQPLNVPLIIAGAIGVLAAGIHGIAGELLVVRKLSLERLASSPFGGARMTKAMIHVTWHVATVAFLVVGCALVVAGAALDGDSARAVAVVAAAAFTGFAAVALGLGIANTGSPRNLLRHPGPLALAAVAVLGWVGAL